MMNKEMMLYIHIPFCKCKCNYCDFLSFALDSSYHEAYVKALINEIEYKAKNYSDRLITSIFIGGGTPSLIDGQYIELILQEIRKEFKISETAEISIESNPGTLDANKLKTYFNSGINRLSIGLQSTYDSELKLLGRIHTFDDFIRNYNAAREAGFMNVNVDMISSLPGQNPDSFEDNLANVIALSPEHISVYSLIIEEGTPFYNMNLNLPTEEVDRDIYYRTREYLQGKGYYQYEISNYSKVGYECVHNLGYWERKEYLGLGLGAASLVKRTDGEVRFKNSSNLSEYIAGDKDSYDFEELTKEDCMDETIFLGLRKTSGVNLKKFQETFACSCQEVYGDWLTKVTKEGLVNIKGDKLTLTYKGMDLANYVMSGFIQG